jgi:hypothetical protein
MLAQETDEVPLEDWQQEKVLIEEDVHAFIKNRKGREAWTLCFGEHETTAAFPLLRCIGLPRQARDKHERKNANKNCVFSKTGVVYGSAYQKTWAPRIFLWQNEKPGLGEERYIKWRESGKKTHIFRALLYFKMIAIPRQALDKHRESTQKKRCVVLRGQGREAAVQVLTFQAKGRVRHRPGLREAPHDPHRRGQEDAEPLGAASKRGDQSQDKGRVGALDGVVVRKTHLLSTLYIKNDYFTKTGSGQT